MALIWSGTGMQCKAHWNIAVFSYSILRAYWWHWGAPILEDEGACEAPSLKSWERALLNLKKAEVISAAESHLKACFLIFIEKLY